MRATALALVLASGALACRGGLTDLPQPPVRKSAADLSGIWDASLSILLDEVGSSAGVDLECLGLGQITLRNIDGVAIHDNSTLSVPRCGSLLLAPLTVTRAEVSGSDYLFSLSDAEQRFGMQFKGAVFVLAEGDLIIAAMTEWEGEALEIGARLHLPVAARLQLGRRR